MGEVVDPAEAQAAYSSYTPAEQAALWEAYYYSQCQSPGKHCLGTCAPREKVLDMLWLCSSQFLTKASNILQVSHIPFVGHVRFSNRPKT